MAITFLFPGQGAQYPGMGKDLFDTYQEVKDLFKAASDAVGYDVAQVIFEGSEEELKQTDKTQMAVTLVNLASAAALSARGIVPGRCAGFSLGEYASLVTAGVIPLEQVFDVVRARGEIMEAVSRTVDTPEGPAGMAAAIGLDFSSVKEVLENVPDAYPGIYNSPSQTVVSGTAEGLTAAEAALKAAGVKRYIRLKVSGPFHCPLMADARSQFEEILSGVAFADPKVPVYSNVSGDIIKTGEEARKLCLDQLVQTVLWTNEMESLVRDGAGAFLEVGPGTVLGGLWKAYAKTREGLDIPMYPAGKLEEIESVPA
jgi:[acyl-carrier-protein] S-malonyltransferase